MAVEDQRGSEDGSLDRFPVGMRVLAVDDDLICLKVLETLLRKCQYQVTTTNQAIKALNMLRENRNKFDLVISDVNMPDMDGFKLLELVGLEMDLPVIMLSAHSDTKLVMKGVTHGACDYLLKPVRMEELKNIWQHVVRRRKLDTKDQSKSPNHDKPCHETGEGRKGVATTGKDQNSKLIRKRKDQNDDDEEEGEENGHENEDPSTQKKARVVWSPELHRKFVASVHELGVDKAFPKKILDLMNVEGLTRENVASHLQKYRAYLKRISTETPQASVVAALGGKDSSYMRTGAAEGFGDLRALAGPMRLANTAPSPSLIQGTFHGRLNSPYGLTLRGITSTGLIQPSNLQNLNNSLNTPGKFQPSFSANQNVSLFQGIPASLEVNQLQQTKCTTHIGDMGALNNSTGLAAFAGGSSIIPNSSSNALMLHRAPQQTHSVGPLGNQSSLRVAASHPKSFDLGINGSSNFLDHNRCSENWQGAVQSSKFPSTALPMSEPSNHGQMHCDDLVISSTTLQIGNNPHEFASTSALPTSLGDSMGNVQGQDGLIGNIVHTKNFEARQGWDENEKDYNHILKQNLGAINSLVSTNSTMGPLNENQDQNNAACSQNFNASIIDELSGGTPPPTFQSNEIGESAADTTNIEPNSNYLFGQEKAQDAFQSSYGSLDDIINTFMKRQQNETTLMDGEMGFDTCALGSCIWDFIA